MKRLIFIFIIALGCSKSDIKPSEALVGNWSFKSPSIAGDFTIANTPNGYSLQAGGKFSINGKSFTCDQFWIPLRSATHVDIYLGSPMINNEREAMLIFSINPSGLPNIVLQPSDVFYELKSGSGLVRVKEEFVLQKK